MVPPRGTTPPPDAPALARAENIVLAFRRLGESETRVEILREGRDGLSSGQVLFVSPMARAVLHELVRTAATPARG